MELSFGEMLMIALVIVVLFGPNKIPEIARGLGQGVRKMKDAMEDVKSEIMKETDNPVSEIKREIEKVKKEVSKLVGEEVHISVVEIKNPDMVAELVAQNIAHQIENRVSFRVAQKKAIRNTMKAGAKGIKTLVSGRLGGADIARGEGYSEGTIPLHTLRADIDYATAEADTTYGKIGVKVWIYKGEILDKGGNSHVDAKKN